MARRWAAARRATGRRRGAGLVRAILAHKGIAADARHWAGPVSKEYRLLLLAKGQELLTEKKDAEGKVRMKVVIKGMDEAKAEKEIGELERSRDVSMGKMLRCRVRYFSDGVAIGSRGFVDGVFEACRERFGAGRKSGARVLENPNLLRVSQVFELPPAPN